MAMSKEKWLEAQGFYEAGLSLSQIQKRVGISRGAISKKAKSEQWKHGKNVDYIEAKELIVEKKATLDPKKKHLLNCADIVADDLIRRKNLIFGASEEVVIKIKDFVKNGKASKVVVESMGEAGSSATVVEYDLQAKDYKDIAEAIDKASVTLGVNPRFTSGINIQNNNENTQQNNTLKVEWID